ncbi:MAG: RidA family protein [Clostridia bacterium]|nr:RidA family protein [Clostridia bacterium]
MKKETVFAPDAPAAVGPYSHGVKWGNLLFVSGQIPADPETGEVPENIEDQTHMAIKNVEAVLRAGGSSLDKVLKATVFITDMDNFGAINEVYAQYFKEDPPARLCVQVSRLPKDVDVEIEAIAAV